MNFATIDEALKDLKKGKMLILLDQKREKEADLYIPGDKITPQIVNTMIKKAGGLVCIAITGQQAHKLALPLMVALFENEEKTGVNFTVSVNAKDGITTGVSAFDRYKTIKIMASPKSQASDLIRPGHVFGLVSKNGGVLERAGHTEAAIDLARLAGFSPSGVLCEILADDGKMADMSFLTKLSKQLNIKIVQIEDLIKYLKDNPIPGISEGCCIVETANAKLPTKYGLFNIIIYKSLTDGKEHAVLTLGKLKKSALVRIHSQCLTGDTFTSLRCDCGEQLKESMKIISNNGSGIILYLNQEGRGIGLTNKIRAYCLQDKGYDTVEANEALGFPSDARSYKIAKDILNDLGVSSIYLLTNNPDKKDQLEKFGIGIDKRVALEIKPNKVDLDYLKVKKNKMQHELKLV